MPFKLGAASRPRPTTMFMKTGTASWCEHAPSRGLVFGVAAMTALMSVTAVSALFVLPHMGKHEIAQDARQADAQQFVEPARDKITTITAEPTGRKNRLAPSAASILVSEANAEEATETPLAADPRWSQVVAASANKPLEAIPAVPGAEKVIATGPIEPEVLALTQTEEAQTDPAATAAIKAMDSKAKADAPDKETREATIKRSVNMRSKPNGAVLAVIPAKTAVELVSCTSWCEVIYKDKRGYVAKSYIK
ncbi:SH3 domain-containing protein [Mesorhizobium sp. ANAO-SY3R2]|uniref:SH3 domain-containing protein n=1 Tax=Mesorhizobium sp. ANAO-SY3R2 TaxID=3166644 RepID=UPI00366D3913